MIDKIIQKLATPKFATILMIHIVAFSIFITFTPSQQLKNFSKDINQLLTLENSNQVQTIEFQDQFETFPVLFSILLLSLSLIISIYFRSRVEFKKLIKQTTSANEMNQSEVFNEIIEKLKGKGYKIQTFGNKHLTSIRGVKGRFGNIGSILFHSSLLIILLGILISKYISFDGIFALTEGQSFNAGKDKFLNIQAGKLFNADLDKLNLSLVRVEPDYEVNKATTIASIINTDSKLSIPLYINNGYSLSGFTLHQGEKIGFSPYIYIADKSGKVLWDSYTRLATISANGQKFFRDYIEFDGGKIRFEFELFPDAVFRNEKLVKRTNEPKAPVLKVAILENKNLLQDAYIPQGNIINISNYEIGFGELRRWSEFTLNYDPGFYVFLIGSILGLIGLIVRFSLIRSEIIINFYSTNGNLTYDIIGTREKFQTTFEDGLDDLKKDLELFIKKFAKLDNKSINIQSLK